MRRFSFSFFHFPRLSLDVFSLSGIGGVPGGVLGGEVGGPASRSRVMTCVVVVVVFVLFLCRSVGLDKWVRSVYRLGF
jgi:hypothetical protein